MCPWAMLGSGGEAALTPAGHCCRSTGCLSSRSYTVALSSTGPPLLHQPSEVPWGLLKQPSVICVVIQQIKCCGQAGARGSRINCMHSILASHCTAAELCLGESTVTGPQFPQSHPHSRLPEGFDELMCARRALCPAVPSTFPTQAPLMDTQNLFYPFYREQSLRKPPAG